MQYEAAVILDVKGSPNQVIENWLLLTQDLPETTPSRAAGVVERPTVQYFLIVVLSAMRQPKSP